MKRFFFILTSHQMSKLKEFFLHHAYQNIGFWMWEVQQWHMIFILTTWRSSEMLKSMLQNILSKISVEILIKVTSERSKWKTDARFEFPTPKNLYFDMHDAKSIFRVLRGEVRGHFWRPPRGQNEKLMPDLNSPPKETYILICIKQKNIFLIWPLGIDQRSF